MKIIKCTVGSSLPGVCLHVWYGYKVNSKFYWLVGHKTLWYFQNTCQVFFMS